MFPPFEKGEQGGFRSLITEETFGKRYILIVKSFSDTL